MSRAFPTTRMRRNRAHPFVRNLTRENELTVNDLIYPMFVIEGSGTREPVASMPGIERLTISVDYGANPGEAYWHMRLIAQ